MDNTLFNFRIWKWHLQLTRDFKLSFRKNNYFDKEKAWYILLISPIALYSPITICLFSFLYDRYKENIWFQDLKKDDNENKLFNFRGSIHSKDWRTNYLEYQLVSGFKIALEFKQKERSASFIIGFFFFTLYLTIPFFQIFKIGKEFGFYFYEGIKELIVKFNYMDNFNISIDKETGFYKRFNFPDILFGKSYYVTEDKFNSYSPIHFKFRGGEYQLDSAKIERLRFFRSRIPFSLYHKDEYRMKVSCNIPPATGGKWGDDGTYGLSQPYEGELDFTWSNRKNLEEYLVQKYVNCVQKNIKRHGRASTDKHPKDDFYFEIFNPNKNNEQAGTTLC